MKKLPAHPVAPIAGRGPLLLTQHVRCVVVTTPRPRGDLACDLRKALIQVGRRNVEGARKQFLHQVST